VPDDATRIRLDALERRVGDAVLRETYAAHERRRDQEIEQLRAGLAEVRDTLRWQGRTLVLWVLGLVVSIVTAVAGLVIG